MVVDGGAAPAGHVFVLQRHRLAAHPREAPGQMTSIGQLNATYPGIGELRASDSRDARDRKGRADLCVADTGRCPVTPSPTLAVRVTTEHVGPPFRRRSWRAWRQSGVVRAHAYPPNRERSFAHAPGTGTRAGDRNSCCGVGGRTKEALPPCRPAAPETAAKRRRRPRRGSSLSARPRPTGRIPSLLAPRGRRARPGPAAGAHGPATLEETATHVCSGRFCSRASRAALKCLYWLNEAVARTRPSVARDPWAGSGCHWTSRVISAFESAHGMCSTEKSSIVGMR
ncbi:hypothetical protein Nans01_33330 [Nocardiopsis ansamitocini]|uniref:Uncharacterized protein n=1 Tax=Nocardiopsis ansamitocini TaxID=1670832 RepID=A0A9W6P8K2_9ACTN|nr:hypothetical protein Nans01_33330 [Nocardiopsis ansamitocini]